ncbi:aromatic ring-hydroxylating oxygenase subunit alpha [Streptomyces sp. BH106]|uniref:aromatic ring-hydroxylating oxygenase subunit alpha n=1 Tax=Streptomyces sp. BH106 TaxID=3410409 RepID=UPI003CF9F039
MTTPNTTSIPHSGADGGLPTSPLARDYYTSEEWHRRDLQRVFRERWLFAGHSSQIAQPGRFFTFELDADSVIVTRTKSGGIKAFHNVCRHRGAQFCQQRSGRTKYFTCPFHGWSYDLEGDLKVAPEMPEEFDKSQFPLRNVWVEEWNGLIFVSFAEQPPRSVTAALAKADFSVFQLERTKVIADRVYDVSANWKVNAETFAECYHCAIGHPEFSRIADPLADLEAWDDAEAAEEDDDLGDYLIFTPDLAPSMAEGAVTLSPDGQFLCRRLLGADDNPPKENAAVSWFPNWGMFVQPDYATTFSWIPTSPTTTRFRSTWLVHEDAVPGQDYDPDALPEFMDTINLQDKELCRIAQAGISSSAYDNSAPYHPFFEAPAMGFLGTYLNHVRDVPADS